MLYQYELTRPGRIAMPHWRRIESTSKLSTEEPLLLRTLKKHDQSLRDFTAATILEKFANESTAQAVERVSKKMAGTSAAEELLRTRKPRLLAHNFPQLHVDLQVLLRY